MQNCENSDIQWMTFYLKQLLSSADSHHFRILFFVLTAQKTIISDIRQSKNPEKKIIQKCLKETQGKLHYYLTSPSTASKVSPPRVSLSGLRQISIMLYTAFSPLMAISEQMNHDNWFTLRPSLRPARIEFPQWSVFITKTICIT